MSVIILPEVQEYVDTLVPILYGKGYFSFEDTAVKYVDGLMDDIYTTLPTRLHKPAPPYFNRYGKGMYYATFRRNRATTWYAFFTRYNGGSETVYLVRYITNNHTAAQHL